MVRSDTYRLRLSIDKELNRNSSRWDLYGLLWHFRMNEPLSWDAIAYLIKAMTQISVSGESLRRWFQDEQGNPKRRKDFYGKEVSIV